MRDEENSTPNLFDPMQASVSASEENSKPVDGRLESQAQVREPIVQRSSMTDQATQQEPQNRPAPARQVQAAQDQPAPRQAQQPSPQPDLGQSQSPEPPQSTRREAHRQERQRQPFEPQGQQQPYGQAAWQGQAGQPTWQYPYAQQPQVVYAAPQKKNRSWIVGVVLIVCLFAFTAFCVKSCTDAVTGMRGSGVGIGPSGDSVAVINIDSTIQYDGTANSPEGFKELLDRASDNDRIKALVLRVNSGGGVATAGEEMASYLADFKKPVVVSSASINASAAYEISSQADYIYVAKSTEIGAIGTAMQLTDLSGLLDMLGVNMDVIASADSKDSSYGYRALTDEEREYYQRMIDQVNQVFIENVAKGRNMSVEDVRALATGLAFTGVDAVENGLADEVGTLENAADKAAELAGVSNYELYDLAFGSYDFSSLYDLLGSADGNDQKSLPVMSQ